MRENRGGTSLWAMTFAAGGVMLFGVLAFSTAHRHGRVTATGVVKAYRQLAQDEFQVNKGLVESESESQAPAPVSESQEEAVKLPANIPQNVWKLFYPHLCKSEGIVNYPYLCGANKLTIGIGYNLQANGDPIKELKKFKADLKFDGRPATDADIEKLADPAFFKSKSFCRRFELGEASIAKMLEARLVEACTGLEEYVREEGKKLGKDIRFWDLPAPICAVWLDIVYQSGVHGGTKRYPSFTRAVLTGDWARAKQECNVDPKGFKGIRTRNADKQKMIQDLIVAETSSARQGDGWNVAAFVGSTENALGR